MTTNASPMRDGMRAHLAFLHARRDLIKLVWHRRLLCGLRDPIVLCAKRSDPFGAALMAPVANPEAEFMVAHVSLRGLADAYRKCGSDCDAIKAVLRSAKVEILLPPHIMCTSDGIVSWTHQDGGFEVLYEG